jgi:hypothetical protein
LTTPAQGAGQNLYTAIVRWYDNDRLAPVFIRPPFYAFVLFKQAVRGNSTMLPNRVAWGEVDGIKVWPLWGEPEKELRVVVINKRPLDAVDVILRVSKNSGYGGATVTRLVSSLERPLESRGPEISYGGITYGIGGVRGGSNVTEHVKRGTSEGKLAWRIYMPMGSAALVVIPRLG